METRVVHQAGSRFDDLPERIRVLVEQAAPLVEEVTGLGLPARLVIRTMTWRQWRRASIRRIRGAFLAEVYELRPARLNIANAKGDVKATRASMRTEWVGIGAQTVDVRGRPEILVLPQALREAGRLYDDRSLLKVVAHELTHVAQ